MHIQNGNREGSGIARLKLEVIRQQEHAAALARQGDQERARRARAKLLRLLFELDRTEAAG